MKTVLRALCATALLFLLSPLSAADDGKPPVLRLQLLDGQDTYQLTVDDEFTIWRGKVTLRQDELFCEELEAGLSFCGQLTKGGEEFRGYIKSGILQYPVLLTRTANGKLEGRWNKLVRYQAPARDDSQISYVHFTGHKY